jgi:23S rRNA (uridine2552-2'-O)-methyltransferase
MSDMAPNLSGVSAIDEAAADELARTALGCAERFLRPGGAFLIKLFQFGGTQSLLQDLSAQFTSVVRRKPASSRTESREFYVVARGFGL